MSVSEQLVDELVGEAGLDAVDAHRGAFTALACASGWSKAEIGRWLGISRARVGQKIDKLLHYSATYDTPVLIKTMRQAVRAKPAKKGELGYRLYSEIVEYAQHDWDDLDFARELLQRLEAQTATHDKAA